MAKHRQEAEYDDSENSMDIDAELARLEAEEEELGSDLSDISEHPSDFSEEEVAEPTPAAPHGIYISGAALDAAIANCRTARPAARSYLKVLACCKQALRTVTAPEGEVFSPADVLSRAVEFVLSAEGTQAFARLCGGKGPETSLRGLPGTSRHLRAARALTGALLEFFKSTPASAAPLIRTVAAGTAAAAPIVALAAPARIAKLVTHLAAHWSRATSATATELIRAAAALGAAAGPTVAEAAIKAFYIRHVRNLKTVNIHTAAILAAQRRGLVGLVRALPDEGFKCMFNYVNQLATFMRTALFGATGRDAGAVVKARQRARAKGEAMETKVNTKRTLKAVATWRYFGALLVWTDVVCAASSGSLVAGDTAGALVPAPATAPDAPIAGMAYPVSQLLWGVVRLAGDSLPFAPMALHAHAALTRLARATGLYMPIAPSALSILRLTGLGNTTTRGADAPLDLTCALRAGPATLNTPAYHETVFTDALTCVAGALAAEARSAAFPELAAVAARELRVLAKRYGASAVQRHRNWAVALKKLAVAAESSAAQTAQERESINCAPTDMAGVAKWERRERRLTAIETEFAKLTAAQIARTVSLSATGAQAPAPLSLEEAEQRVEEAFAEAANEAAGEDESESEDEDEYSDYDDEDEDEGYSVVDSDDEGAPQKRKPVTRVDIRPDGDIGKDKIQEMNWDDF